MNWRDHALIRMVTLFYLRIGGCSLVVRATTSGRMVMMIIMTAFVNLASVAFHLVGMAVVVRATFMLVITLFMVVVFVVMDVRHYTLRFVPIKALVKRLGLEVFEWSRYNFVLGVLHKHIVFPNSFGYNPCLDIKEIGCSSPTTSLPLSVVVGSIVADEFAYSVVISIVVVAMVDVSVFEVVNALAVRLVIHPVAFVN